MATKDPVNSPLQPEWDEAQYEAALRHLDQVQQQISDLRWNVPQMLRGFSKDYDSPQRMYADFERSAYLSVRGHKELKASWESDYLNDILDKAYDLQGGPQSNNLVVSDWVEQTKSAAKDKLTFPDWDRNTPIYLTTEALEESPYMSDGTTTKEFEIGPIVEKFQKDHPKLKVGFDEEHHVIAVVVPIFGSLEFTIEQADGDKSYFKASCKGNSTLCQAITRSIRMHPLRNDLQYILDLIASYINLRTSPCLSCKTVMDKNSGLPPVTRRLKVEVAPDGKKTLIWLPLHDSCHRFKT